MWPGVVGKKARVSVCVVVVVVVVVEVIVVDVVVAVVVVVMFCWRTITVKYPVFASVVPWLIEANHHPTST
jgi:hypothetical protein